MTNIFSGSRDARWTLHERAAARALLIFAVLVTVPLAPQYWRLLREHHVAFFQVLFDAANYVPTLLPAPPWGLASFSNLFALTIIAAAGGYVWAAVSRERTNDIDLYDLARTLLRYKLAFAMLAYGIAKFFPLQFPHPTLSDLNTEYGDFLPWKIYYLTTGAASAGYQRSLGAFEVISGILLLWRRWTTAGAAVAVGALADIVLVNFAYQAGDHIYATLLLLISGLLLLNDVQRLFNLLVLRRTATAERFHSHLTTHPVRVFARGAVFVFFAVYTAATYAAYRSHDWPGSGTSSLADAEGLYDVKEFAVNGRVLPYSAVDPVRWQNVVFERWNTLSIRSNRPDVLQVRRPGLGEGAMRDYEVAGNNGRHFYRYTPDGAALNLTGRNDPGRSFHLNLRRPAGGEIVLDGTDEHGDRIHAVLQKLNKTYLLNEGRRKPLNID